MSKRQRIFDLVIERMEAISTANGYETDLGTSVEDWQTNWDDEQLPALSVCDLVAEIGFVNSETEAPTQFVKLPIQFRIFAKSDTLPADLRKMCADVIRAVGADPKWEDEDGKKLALWTRVTASGIRLQEDQFEIGGAAVEIEIGYLVTSFES